MLWIGWVAGSAITSLSLPPAERATRLQQTARRLAGYPRLTPELIAREAVAARERGHVMFLDWVVEQKGGIAVPILNYEGQPLGALSIAALSERLRSREARLARRLKDEARRISSAWTRRAGPR